MKQEQQKLSHIDVVNEDKCDVIDTFDVEELEQRFEYDTNITICHYEWH